MGDDITRGGRVGSGKWVVYTFVQPDETGNRTLSRITAYTGWVNTGWPGCRRHTVDAASGAEAIRAAKRERLAMWKAEEVSRG